MVGQTNKLDGSNPGGGGGAGLLEFLRSACWMGVDVGLEAEGPVVVGVEVSTVSPPTLDGVVPIDFGVGLVHVGCLDRLCRSVPNCG